MKKMKKMAAAFIASVSMVFLLAGCTTTMSFTFAVNTGDNVKVSLDTSDDYKLSQEDGTFTIKNGDEDVLQGAFIPKETYDQYLGVVEAADAKVIEESKKDGITYLFYEFEGEAGTENNFIVWIDKSDTGMLLASLSGEKNAKTAFDRLSFEIGD